MSKYWYLFVLSFVVLSAYIAVPDAIQAAIPRVETQSVSLQDTQLCVMATGRIEGTGVLEIKSDMPVVLSEILVQSGDYVKKGDALATVDVNATKKILLTQGDYDRVSQIPDTIKSHKDGTVSAITAVKDVPIQQNTAMLSLISPSDLQVRISISEDVISSVKTGQKVVVTGSGFKGRQYSGTIDTISPDAKVLQNGATLQTMVEAVVLIDNPDKYLKPGFTAKVRIITEVLEDALVVPYEAIGQNADNRQFVYVQSGDKAQLRYIQTEGDCDEGAIVKSGVKNGERVIINPSSLTGDTVDVVVVPERSVAK
ncbi:MAG: HlyD family efflux transporter periplasmic adaptor subunit [Clostridia bacterium]|nr:HlyD family efflux transporter periplasmic adaptor subunit [Clostridia bacterium]